MRPHIKRIISIPGNIKTSLYVFALKSLKDLFVEVLLGDITVLFAQDLVLDGIGPRGSPEETSGCE